MSTTDESVQRSSKMKEIVSLTQLRAIALLLVFICHSPSIPGIRELAHGLNVFTPLGQIGVGLFFILSGFVLGHNYLSLRICSGREYFQYLWNRLARLYPTHLVTFAIAIPLSFYGQLSHRLSLFSFLTNLTLTQTWFPSTICFNTCTWALSMIVVFYCVFPFLARVASVFGLRCILLGGSVIYILAFMLCALGFVDFLTAKFHPFVRIHEFAIGLALSQGLAWLTPSRARKMMWIGIWFSGLILGAIVFLNIPMLRYYSIFTPALAMVILGCAGLEQNSKFGAFGMGIYQIGRTSFAFYMFHQLVLRYAHGGLQFMGCRPFGAFSVLLVVIIYAVAVLFSIKWTRYVEIPIAAFLKRKNPFTNSEQR